MKKIELKKDDIRHEKMLEMVVNLLRAGRDATSLMQEENDDYTSRVLSTLPTAIMVLTKGVIATLGSLFDCELLDVMMDGPENLAQEQQK